jgi:hypothetical protein
MKQLIFILVLLCAAMTNPLQSQTAITPNDSFYVVTRYLKVLPGMQETFDKQYEVWKKILQKRQDTGEIMYWRLFKRSFPQGTSSDFDYISVTAIRDVNVIAKYDSMSLAENAKGLPKEEADLILTSDKVRSLVSRALFKFKGSQPQGKEAKYLRVTGVEVLPGKNDDYLALLKQSIPVMSEAMKSGKMTDRQIYQRCFPNDPNLPDYGILVYYKSLSDAVSGLDYDFTADFKKVYPNQPYSTFQAGVKATRNMVSMQLWERVTGTK